MSSQPLPLPFPLNPYVELFYNMLSRQGQQLFQRIFSMVAYFYQYEVPFCGMAYEPLALGLAPDVRAAAYDRMVAIMLWLLGIFDPVNKKLTVAEAEYLFISVMYMVFPPGDIEYYEHRAAFLIEVLEWDLDTFLPKPWPDMA